MPDLPPQYNPKAVEEARYRWWESQGLFQADVAPRRQPYTIVIPPPNITGILHMGHALNNTIQDILIRFKRMQGKNALWVPGTDHAGIATQNVVERALAKELVTYIDDRGQALTRPKQRQDVGREEFLKRVWEWKEQYGNTILYQLKRLGASCDWRRTRFTMDEGLSEAVTEVFIRLYQKGLIYRGNYIINWCPRCQTALADEEAPRQETQGKLYHIRYPLEGGKGHIEVATTRPETMLGDTAVAVHPKDKRYKALIGQHAILPLVNCRIPIIADELVDPKFGTGAVKVTPAHDPVDFQLGKKHKLEFLTVMTDDARMTNVPAPYGGLDRFDCRSKLIVDLEQQGFLGKIDEHLHNVGHCYRCGTVVEPRLSPQWFVRMKPLARPAIKAVKDGTITFSPTRWTKVYLNWMEHIQDWCISRQIWWGHRIPVWMLPLHDANEKGILDALQAYFEEFHVEKHVALRLVREPSGIAVYKVYICTANTGAKKAIEALNEFYQYPPYDFDPKKLEVFPSEKAKGIAQSIMDGPAAGQVVQDSDVLDTWFSSWLWPFSTLGWPKKTKDLDHFYPTDTLVTAPEIIFFWVARMIMAGYFCMKKPPFTKVYIHGTVRDLTGKKMSKSLGNIIDPLEIIKEYGTDALRYTLVTATAIGQDVFLSEERFVAGRNFANKLWNATRFLLSQGPVPASVPQAQTIADRWILSRLQHTLKKVTAALETMFFNEAASSLYDFLWHDVCDWYIEISKYVQPAEKENARAVLAHVLEVSMRLLHPFMPFVTEELWQQLRPAGSKPSIMVSVWPAPDKKLVDTKAEAQFERFKAVVTSIRTTRAELNVPNDRKTPTVWLISKDAATRRFFDDHKTLLQALAQVSTVAVLEDFHKQKDAIVAVLDGVEVVIPLGGLIDVQKETKRKQQEVNELNGYVEQTTARLKDKQFTEKAPAEVIEQSRKRLSQAQERLKKLSDYLAIFQSM